MKIIRRLSIITIWGLLSATSCNSYSDVTPHSSEEIDFTHKTFNISGELLIPEGQGTYPLVIMVHGDGPAYMSYFKTIKYSFVKAGYATLMWDKPGFGKSTGAFSKDHLLRERAEILLKAIEIMKSHPGIRPDKIGFWGISQAGYVIPMALEKTDDISFMILVGVGGENGIEQTAYYIEQQLICEGFQEDTAMKAGQNFINLCYADTYDEYLKNAKPMVENSKIKAMGFVSAIWPENEWKPKDKDSEGFYNPIDIMENTSIPSMVFFGDLDKNVDPFQGFQAYTAAFEKAGNPNFIVKMIKGGDHNIIISETGCSKERNARTSKGWSNYDQEYLQMMEYWLTDLKKIKPSQELLNKYTMQSSFTDPGDFAFLYDDLPESTKEICNIIKKQLIHPMEASQIRDILPEGRAPEDGDFPAVSDMLQGLIQRDSSGLSIDREPEDRLIVACYHHGLLLASMLRHQNIPVRLRAGWARYYEEEAKVRFGHVVCEVWDKNRGEWIIIDPDRNIIDVPENSFEYPAEAWQAFYGTDYRSTRYVSSNGEGFQALLHALLLDHAFVIGRERNYWNTPSFVFKEDFYIDKLDIENMEVIKQISECMFEPDNNMNELIELYEIHPFIHEHKRSIMDYYEKAENDPND